ncbi:hypothetical protein SY27_04950 [Flavobacterium sp. 316]|uniref:hypothetical protein n=1 Tax=Flavobacterium sp. 316 TaxID=1603293 RepID=UPI0005DFFAE2|nr:hypothetical protein [Flavobacterium sp. 316]KIX22025.1 hypothetical protein SY27_04950 [Flavobacterium sp. 316]
MKNIFYIFVALLYSCNSIKNTTAINDYKVESSDVKTFLQQIERSNIKSLKLEKELFLISKFSENDDYLNSLNHLINGEIESFNDKLLTKNFNAFLKNVKRENIDEIYVLYMQYSGEMIYDKVITIVKEDKSYVPIMFLSDNSSNETKIEFTDESLVLLLEEYRQNLNYSFKNKSLFNNAPQYFFINKIEFKDGEIENIDTFFKSKMLSSEKKILETVFFNEK